MSKRRISRELDKRCILSDDDITKLKIAHGLGTPIIDIAKSFGVSEAAVYYWLFPEYRERGKKYEGNVSS